MKTSLPPFIKYPKIVLYEEHPDILKSEVIVFEKLDGGNCQFRKLITGRILCGNRSNYLNEKYFNRYWFMDFLRWVHRNYSLFVIEPKYIFYGEWLAPHTLEYAKEFQNRFYLIDIFDTEVEKFLEYPRSCELIQEYQLKDINLLNPLFTGRTKRGDCHQRLCQPAFRKIGQSKIQGTKRKCFHNPDLPYRSCCTTLCHPGKNQQIY